MLKKAFSLVLTTIICILLLVSCQIPGMGTGTGTGTGDDTVTLDIKTVVYADETLDLMELRTALSKISGAGVRVMQDTAASDGAELVIGNTSRPITAAAKSALEKELSKTEDYDIGYIIYSDGKSIAVYWSLSDMAEIAILKLMSETLSGSKIEAKEGTLYTEFYKKDVFERDKAWAIIEANADPDVVSALKELYAFFDGTMLAGWAANLYDPEIGGFYYSISARDTAGYYPDLESTNQVLGLLRGNGAFKSSNTVFPEDIKAKLVAFAKSMQSPVDGYFYHPQWPQGKENLDVDRYGRDQGSAVSIINTFTLDTDGDGVGEKQYPNYCNLVKGVKCEKHADTSEKCVFPITEIEGVTSAAVSDTEGLTDVIGVSVSSAVSKVRAGAAAVIATATVSSHPDYSSREAFSAWLEQYNNPDTVKINSGNAHKLSSIRSEIYSHGMLDILLDHLDRIQAELFDEQIANGEEPTGVWQRNIDYNAVWGMIKYLTIYNDDGGRAIDVKYLSYMVKTCVKVLQIPPAGNYHMNDVYNQWGSITYLLSNVQKYNPGSEQIIYDIIRENIAPLIENTLAKIEDWKIDDGSIGYTPGGLSLSKIYGVPISLGVREGDVNGVSLCCSMYRSIVSCLGYTPVPIFTESDGKLFVQTLISSEPIVKNETKAEAMDFEEGTIPTKIAFSKGSGNASANVAPDPENFSNSTLCFTSDADPTGSGGTLAFTPVSVGDGCYVFESRMYIDYASGGSYIFQLLFSSKLYMIAMYRSGNSIVIKESTTKNSDAKMRDIATVPMNEWFTLRVEYYVQSDDSEDGLPHIKVWVNDELKTGDSSWYYNSHLGSAPSTGFTEVSLYSMRTSDTCIYIDDVYCARETKTFDLYDSQISE